MNTDISARRDNSFRPYIGFSYILALYRQSVYMVGELSHLADISLRIADVSPIRIILKERYLAFYSYKMF